MDPVTVSLIVGVITLVVERVFSVVGKIRKSKCCSGEVELADSPRTDPAKPLIS